MDTQTLGAFMLILLPLAAVGIFVWGHKHGAKSVSNALATVGYHPPASRNTTQQP